MHNPASLVLYGFMQKKNIPFRYSTEYLDKRFNELKDTIYLMVQVRDQYKHGLYIHKNNHLLVNNFFEEEIIKSFCLKCDTYRLLKLPKTKAADDFCTENDIELDKDISLEALLKAEYRFRMAKKNIQKDRAKMSDC